MNTLVYLGIDLIAIAALTTFYFRRHRRRDLVVSYLCVNVGVLAVTQVLATSVIGAGLGLGLFGVLSIIRLRSSEIAQHEVAYYFAALTIGLLAGIGGTAGMPAVLIAVLIAVLAVGDHPRLLPRYRQQLVLVDRAIADEAILAEHLSAMLGGRVAGLTVQRLDLVNDTTLVDVRYRLDTGVTRRGAVDPSGEPGAGHPERIVPAPAAPLAGWSLGSDSARGTGAGA